MGIPSISRLKTDNKCKKGFPDASSGKYQFQKTISQFRITKWNIRNKAQSPGTRRLDYNKWKTMITVAYKQYYCTYSRYHSEDILNSQSIYETSQMRFMIVT